MEPPDDAPAAESRESSRLRFEIELEFVQLLANPFYLQYLAQRGFMKDRAFVNYLDYLQYWRRPEYAKFIVFPDSLAILDLLQYEAFREEIAKAEVARFVFETETQAQRR
ncbi:mediator of RNA polymerase II transcription subunit 31-like protein [Hyaloraphidium curvatum]|nr:mediator of RNA polymerase II transcription subunit 31-like protein [Hyaloraphidium curvatum]